jgi:endoplasmic reticulum Man9GlcNAc2 1,2-alpha-mannosidase
MYKDKPHSYATSNRARPYWKRRPFLVLVMLVVAGAYWVWGMGSPLGVKELKSASEARFRSKPALTPSAADWPPHKGASSTPTSASKLRGMVKNANGTSGRPDWEARQQCVKEAFRLSWDAYARDAWGKLQNHRE